MKKQWSEADKAVWHLENGYPKIQYFYFRVESTGCYFKQAYRNTPPWVTGMPKQISKEDVPDDVLITNVATEHELFARFQ